MKIEYFDDKEQQNIADGALERLERNRLNITVLPTGWGKTTISLLVAGKMAQKLPNKTLNLIIMAIKAKREDREFEEAVRLAETKFGVHLNLIPIKGNKIVTTNGLAAAMKDKKWHNQVLRETKGTPTMFILDEVHMAFRNSATVTAKTMMKLVTAMEKSQPVSILGLTATPFDTSILDVAGYQVLAGQYNSRNQWYVKNVAGFKSGYSHQSGGHTTLQEINKDIVDPTNYSINLDGFTRFEELMEEIVEIIYVPDVAQNFHLPTNEFEYVGVDLSPDGKHKYQEILEAEAGEYYDTQSKVRVDKTTAMTIDKNVINTVADISTRLETKQPLIFYFFEDQRQALVDEFNKRGVDFKELNGSSHSFFEIDITDDMPVLVNYKSGATSFGSKVSNTSIYLSLPDSSVDFEQSLGRNTRRGQELDVVMNYIIVPRVDGEDLEHFEIAQRRINEKVRRNKIFINLIKDIEAYNGGN